MADKFQLIGTLMLPIFILIIIAYGFIKKINIFDTFIEGANDGLLTLKKLIPVLIGIMAAVEMLSASGLADFLAKITKPFCDKVGLPSEMIPFVVLRPISGSGSTALLTELLEKFGPDSLIGKIASVLAGSTETTFYAISVYFQSVNIKNVRHTVICALMADFTALIMSITLVRLIF